MALTDSRAATASPLPPIRQPSSVAPATAATGAGLLAWFTGAHLVNDFNALMLPAFLPAMTDEFGLSYLQLGILSLSFTVLSGVLQVFAGHYADRYGRRRRALVFGFAITAVGFVAMGISPTFALLVAASLLCGLGASTYHPQATAFLMRAYPKDKGRTMGVHGWGGSVGNFIAPLGVALLVTALGWRPAIIALAVPPIVVGMLLRRNLAESSPNPTARLKAGVSRDLIVLSVTFALLSMVIRGFLTFLPTFLVDRGSSLAAAGVLTTMVMIVGLVAQPLGGIAFDRRGGRFVFLAGALGTMAGLALFAATSLTPVLLFAVAGVAFFVFALFPVSLAMGSELVGLERTGVGVGVVFGISGLSGAAVQPALGAIADATSLHVALSLLIVVAAAGAALSLRLPAHAPRNA